MWIVALSAVGAALWWLLARPYGNADATPLLVIAAIVVSLVPGVNRQINAALDRIRHPRPSSRFVASILISIAAAVYLYITARLQHRDFIPMWHDEQSLLIQAQM